MSSLESGSQPVSNDLFGVAYQLFTLQFTTIAKLHLRSSQENDWWLGPAHGEELYEGSQQQEGENHCSQSTPPPPPTCYPGTYERHNFSIRQYLIHSYLSQFKTWLGFSTYLVSNTRIQSKRCSGLLTLLQNGSYEVKKYVCIHRHSLSYNSSHMCVCAA